MALGALGEIAVGAVRIIAQVLFELFFETLIRGAGWVICRPFRRHIDVEGRTVMVVGIVFWLGVAMALYAVISGGTQ